MIDLSRHILKIKAIQLRARSFVDPVSPMVPSAAFAVQVPETARLIDYTHDQIWRRDI